jgi:hypothetical protein
MVSLAFNNANLKSYFGEENDITSRTTSIQIGEDEEDIPTTVTPVAPISTELQGPLTRARGRQLNYQVLLFPVTFPNIYENRMLPKSDVILSLRNEGPSMAERDKFEPCYRKDRD